MRNRDVSIYGYKMVSNAVQALRKELGVVQILHEGSHYKGSVDKVVINYGSSSLPPNVLKSQVLNKPTSVALCVDKLRFFSHLYEIEADVETPEWTNDPKVAKAWMDDENKVILARTVLNGRSGQGIKILRKGVDFIGAPLYTVYVPKQYEYRVHVLAGRVIDIQRKVQKKGEDLGDEGQKIRSHHNGWIFSRDPSILNIPSPHIEELAKKTTIAMDLTFGAVDIIWSQKLKKAFTLEVNTAPGLEGTSVKIWGDAFREYLSLEKVNV